MYKNINVEAEHNELILENSNGDKVIIPANKRNWVKQKLSEGCHNCIDSLVETLPVASQYAQDGSVYPPNKKVKVNQDGQIKEYDISSPEYKDLYNSGKLMSYDKNSNTYISTPLKEVVITAEAPQWLKDKRQFEKEYSKDRFIDEAMPKFSRSMGISSTNMNPNNVAEYDKRINDKVVENIFKRKPTFDTDYSNDRLKTLQGFTQKELELIKNSSYSSKIEPSIWSKFEQGLLSVGNAGSPVAFKNPSLSQEEAKKEDNPLNILQPLSIPSKMVQSAYKDNYSFKDALKGKQNNANIGEDIITDPLNLVGAGLVGKLSKADKVIDATKILTKRIPKTLQEDVVDLYRIQEKGAKTFSQLAAEGKIPKVFNNEKIIAKKAEEEKYFGQWFTKDKADLDWYARDREFTNPEIIHLKVPKSKLSQYQNYDKTLSRAPEREFVIPHAEQKLYNVDAAKAGSKVLNKTDDVVKNLPKLEQIPLDFKIEDVLKNISSTERKNMEIVKKGNAYFKELDNPESLKRLKEFGDEYSIDLLDAYKKAEKRWDYGNNIGKNDRFQVAGKEVFKDDIESALGLSTVTDDYFKMKMLKPKTKTLIPENKAEIDKYSINYVNKKASIEDYDTIVWHELSHDINKNIIGQSTKLQNDLSNIFVKSIDEVDKTKIEAAYKSQKFDTYEKGLVKSKKENMSVEDIAKDELTYVSKPTETWAFLSTNLRQDLKNTGIIKNYNELLTPEKLEQAIKNGNTVFSRFEPYIKDKDAFIKLFNKMTLSIAPAVLYLQSQQNKSEQ